MTASGPAGEDRLATGGERIEARHVIGAGASAAAGLVATAFTVAAGRTDSDTAIDFAELPGCSVRAASVRGRHHRSVNRSRAEAYAVATCLAENGGQYLCLAISGSGRPAGGTEPPGADDPAVVAVEILISELAGTADGLDWIGIVDRFQRQLADRLQPVGWLLAALALGAPRSIHGVSYGGPSCWSVAPDRLMRLGDGSVSGPSWFSRAIRPGDGVVAVSDGVAGGLGDGRSPLAVELVDLWRGGAPDPFEFAAQLDFAYAGHDDDRTAVGIWVR